MASPSLGKDRPTPVGEVDLNQQKDLESEEHGNAGIVVSHQNVERTKIDQVHHFGATF
jgi:hypothetical protein